MIEVHRGKKIKSACRVPCKRWWPPAVVSKPGSKSQAGLLEFLSKVYLVLLSKAYRSILNYSVNIYNTTKVYDRKYKETILNRRRIVRKSIPLPGG